MPKPWSEVAASPAFKALPPEDQDGARKQYFEDVVAPQVPADQHEVVWEQFSTDTGFGRRELPAGVAPSSAGGGRGRVNPSAQPAAAAIAQPAEAAPAGDASGAGDAAAIMAAAQPAHTSVLEGQVMPEPQFDAAEAQRLSSRSYAETTPQPGSVLPSQSVRASGPRAAPSKATERGEALVDAVLPIRAVFKGVSGLAKGAGGVMRAVGDVTGIDQLSAAGRSTAQGAEEFEQGMGTQGAVAGFGPKSPVPYLSNQAEGAASSLGQSAYYASMLGPRAVIPLMSVMSAGQEYDKARNAGLDPAAALAGAVPKGAFEAIGEKFTGLDKVAGAMGTLLTKGASAQAKKGAAEVLIKSGIKEIPGEVITYLGQTGVDLLPGIGLNPDLTMGQFVDGLRDTVVQSAMMGGAMAGGGRAAQADPRIKRLRDAGETGAADLLQQKLDQANTAASVDGELTNIAPLADFAATPEFQADYRLMRTEGVKPVEAAGRSALTSTFRGLASTAGMPEKALNAAMEAAKKVGLDKLPGFLQRYTASLAAKGLIQPVDGMDALGASLELTRDHAMNAAIGATLPPEDVRTTMDNVQALENAQTPAVYAQNSVPDAENPGSNPLAELPASASVDFAAHDAATSPLNSRPEPTQAQKEAGNYKVGRVNLHGLNISIENPEGSTRRGVDPETGKPWENTLAAHYGYIRGTEGNDGDHVDTFIGPNPDSDKVFVIDQVNKDGTFDEHKVMLGADSLEQADELYHANYAPGWTGRGAITEMPLADFKAWVRDGVKTQPLGSQVQAAQQQQAKATAPDVQNSPVRPPVTTETTGQAATAETGAPAGGEAAGVAAARPDAGAATVEAAGVAATQNPKSATKSADSATGKATSAPKTDGSATQAAAVATRADELHTFSTKARTDGTLAITGDAKAIREALSTIPAKSIMAMRGGVLVGRTQADKAAAILRGETPKLSAREAAEAGQAVREAEKKAQQAAARAKPAPSGLSVGMMPSNAAPVTVTDGVVFIGKNEAVNFDSGEPVTVPAGATDQQIVDALKDAGALSRRQRVFGLAKEGEGLTAPTKEDVLAQQQRKDAGDKADAKAATAAESKAKVDAERNEFTLTGSDRAADVGAAGGQDSLLARKGFDADAFSRMFRPPTAMAVSDVQKAVDQFANGWKSGPRIKVVAIPADLPIDAPADARGLIHDGTAYIVAGNHLNRDGVAKTLGHEAVGHFGLWRMLGDDGQKRFERNLQLAMRSNNTQLVFGAGTGKLVKLSDKIRANYLDKDGNYTLTPAEESSEIAAFAVENAIDPATGEFKPGFGFVKEVYAKVADFLRKLGIYVKFTNLELQGMLVSAMRGLKAGHRLDGGGQVLVAAARDGHADVASVLLELGQHDGLFQMPRSESRDLAEIAMAKGLKVAPVDRNSTDNKLWMLANTTPTDAPGVNSWIVTLPNGKHGTLTNDKGKVYINVSSVGEGNRGNAIYDLAANYAATNGLQFIGDPNGVSPAAMRRRLENMLSSAVKYGTTNHLAPHPDQLEGNKAIGVPPLKWTEGDTLGNINAMVAASTAATEASNPVSTSNVHFDAATQSFRDGENHRLDDASLSAMLGFDGRKSGTGSAGRATLQRNALFRALLQSEGARRAFLEQLRAERSSGGSGAGDSLKGSFYARGDAPRVDQTETPAFKKWFGDSKVVDDAGKPLVMYHGTGKDIKSFDGRPVFLTPSAEFASTFAQRSLVDGGSPNVMAVYASAKNPFDFEDGQHLQTLFGRLGGISEKERIDIVGGYWKALEKPKVQRAIKAGGFDAFYVVEGMEKNIAVLSPEQIKSAIGNNGDFDGASPNIAFARGTGNLFKPNIWTTPAPTRTDKVIYELQDGKVDLKRVQEAIKKSGQEITEQYDARLAETLYPGRVAYRSKTFLDTEAKPLLEAMSRNNVAMDEMADYLHARGAEERNAQIAKVNPNMPDGGAGTNTKGVLMTNDAAAAYLANVGQAKRVVLDAMAKRVDTITAGTRKLLVDEGLEKQETIDAWEGAYKNYVPMFRDEAETAMPPHPQGSGFAVKGSASKRATGSTKEVTNILAHVLMQREAAITRAEKNRVALALYGQALSHPNPDFWTTIRPGMKAAEIGAELQAMGVDPMTAEVGMEGVPTIRTVDPITNKVVDRPNPIYKNLPGAIPLKVNGADRVLMLNVENERGRRLAESLKNLDGLTQLDLAGSIIGKATRWLAAVNTQYNPAFGLANLTRDALEGAINIGSTELRGHSLRVLAQVPLALQGIGRELATGKGGSWGDLYKQFVADGGQTGFKEGFRDPNERARAVEKELERMHSAGRLTPGNAAHAALDLLDGFNTTMENAVRLAGYKVALENGMSRAQAARLGRELTVDFNRKGRAGREVGPMYAFFNASVQGAERALRTLRGPTGGKIIAGGLALGVIQALMLAAAGYDDDEIPEYVKTRAFVIPLNWTGKGEKKHILIPLPLGFLMVPNTGRVLTELTLNGGKDMGKRIVEAVGTIAGSFNPLGGGNIFTPDGALRTLAPTLVDPLIELGFNKNFAGSPIEKQAYGSETDGRPGAARAKESTQRSTTGQAYIGISKAINTLAGGTPYQAGVVSPTPERVRYIAQTVGGGVLREIEKTINASTAAAAGGKVKSSQIPVLGRFYGEVDDDQVAMTRYFEGAKKLKTLESSLNAAAKQAGGGAAMLKMLEEHPEAAFIKAQSRVRSEISKLNKQAVGTVDNPEVMKVIDTARVEKMRALNEAIEDMERARGKKTLGDRIKPKRQPEVATVPP